MNKEHCVELLSRVKALVISLFEFNPFPQVQVFQWLMVVQGLDHQDVNAF